MRQIGEPSVEEILESIKQVIARDNRAAATGGPERGAQDGPGAAIDPTRLNPGDEPDDVLELTQTEPALASSGETGNAEALIGERARNAMRVSLNTLAALAEPGGGPTAPAERDNALEALVRELLRPQLADWLDRHLPRMVEEMVSAEIARIVGRR